MSRDMAFYKVSRVDVPAKITEIPDGFAFVTEEMAEPWEKTIGTSCDYTHRTIDLFDACKDIFGKEISSIGFSIAWKNHRVYFTDGTYQDVTDKQLEPYYYDNTEHGYIYQEEVIAYVNRPYIFDKRYSGVLDDETIEEMINTILDGYDDYYGLTLVDVCKARREMINGATVVCKE